MHKKGLAPKVIHAVIVATLRKNVTSYDTMKERMVAEFKHGKESLEVAPHSGEPLTVTTPERVTKVHDMVMGHRRVTVRYIANSVAMSQEIVHFIYRRSEYEKTLSPLGTQTSDS